MRSTSVSVVLIFIIQALPLIAPSWLPFGPVTGKGFFFLAAMIAAIGAYAVSLYEGSARLPQPALIRRSVALFLCILFFADLLGADPAKSFFSSLERMGGFFLLGGMYAYFIILCSMPRARWNQLFMVQAAAGFSVAVVGLLQLGLVISTDQVVPDGILRINGTVGNSAYLAAYSLLIFFISLLMFGRSSARSARMLYATSAALQALIVYHTVNRAAFIGLAIGCAVSAAIAFFSLSDWKKHLRKGAIAIAVLIIAASALLFAAHRDQSGRFPVIQRILSIGSADATTLERLMLWNIAYQGFRDRPILGWGQENFSLAFDRHFDVRLTKEQWFDRAHNAPLDWLVQAGILGAIAYLSIFAAALIILHRRSASRLPASERAILTGLLCAYFFYNLLSFDTITSYLLFFTVLAYIHASASPAPEDLSRGRRSLWLNASVGIAVLLIISAFIAPSALSAYYAKKASVHKDAESAALYRKSLEIDHAYFAKRDVFARLISDCQAVLTDPKSSQSVKEAYEPLCLGAISSMRPIIMKSAKLSYAVGAFFEKIGDKSSAKEYLEAAHELSPSKEMITRPLERVSKAK